MNVASDRKSQSLGWKGVAKKSVYQLLLPFAQHGTEIGKEAWLFAKLQPGRARKRMNTT